MNLFQEMEVNYKDFIESANDFMDSCREYKNITEDEDLNDILYDIDMQLYDEFNDKIATMNDHLGDVYSLRDVEEVENAQKEKEIQLLRVAIIKQQKEIEKLKENNGYHLGFIDGGIAKRYEMQDKIKAKIEEVKDGIYDAKIVLQSLLEKE